ncbi:MAG: purine-binding chemotaxis protein CheW [Coriobacteriia bacterium]|nr:purine-binding chemotaxis protein CheW [Coriobacteriia bacterium]
MLGETAEEVLARRADSLALETFEEEVADRLSLLLFRIGEEWYAVRVGDVREIFQEYEITPVPGVPDFILGVVNVRGEILSVTDSAAIMGLGVVDQGVDGVPPAIVITNGPVASALVVDAIGDIAEITNQQLEPPITIIDRQQAEYISGSVYLDGTMVGIINIDRVLEPVVTGRH